MASRPSAPLHSHNTRVAAMFGAPANEVPTEIFIGTCILLLLPYCFLLRSTCWGPLRRPQQDNSDAAREIEELEQEHLRVMKLQEEQAQLAFKRRCVDASRDLVSGARSAVARRDVHRLLLRVAPRAVEVRHTIADFVGADSPFLCADGEGDLVTTMEDRWDNKMKQIMCEAEGIVDDKPADICERFRPHLVACRDEMTATPLIGVLCGAHPLRLLCMSAFFGWMGACTPSNQPSAWRR